MLKRILTAFDGSPKSYDAFNICLEMSERCPAMALEIFVLSVAQPPELTDIVGMDAIIGKAKQHYEELFKGLREKARERNIRIKTEVVVGDPAGQIVTYATKKNCDMVILGHRGKSTIERWLLGSVSTRVATHSPCTVVIVK
jgi:nucleotide-binding universal stress UspA family protein